tara:strand:- start:1338 stop:1658 length:321 start_codon:yes stop_codon:yes gene_type:complete
MINLSDYYRLVSKIGFFSDLWSGIKSVAGRVYDVVRKPVDFLAGAGDFLKKIPFVGNTLSTLASPVTGLAKTVQGGLNTARDVASVGSALGLQQGGMVPMKKFYQA